MQHSLVLVPSVGRRIPSLAQSVCRECWTGNKRGELGFGFVLPWELAFPQDGGGEYYLGHPSWEKAGGSGFQAELVLPVGDIVSLLCSLAQDALAGACPQCDRTVHSSSANSLLLQPWGILQHWDHPARSWETDF